MSLNPSRPSSSELVELHVFYVPEGSWNYKLNTISIEVINNFISAGFIRVSPQLTLQALRERLGEFLGVDAVAEKFLFLKCIGNNLAVVKEKQESELKLKSFAPPYALQPELYLLPVIDHLGNVYSASTVTLDEQESINDTTEINGTIYRPDSVSLSKDEPGNPSLLENTWRDFTNQEEAEESQPTQNHFGNSKLLGSLEESNDYFGNLKSPFLWKNDDEEEDEEKDNAALSRRQATLVCDKECTALPDLIDFPSFPSQRVSSRLTDTSLLKIETSDSWKKKYLDTKKVTASLEEVLTKLREDLELYYKKLLMQLEAREIKMRPRNLANISDSKMRKQAVSDLQTLKADLTQKKMGAPFRPPMFSGSVPT
ncbi:spermatogenesis-associated protein 1 isoform X6 [Mus musculus]|uniref:spermatogenesis-associated protein 1 isoform X6 n=1 Tax=Mus musculus TaxID=10090 RepID=UPI0000217043|nr:spermatogenesis-associated protein 1 isoform X6 [Mus musculus]|eukprot:XP_017175212.1 PREDICTED: spermatogenesis-associated protein 1 isoform X6 [Mus musculus]